MKLSVVFPWKQLFLYHFVVILFLLKVHRFFLGRRWGIPDEEDFEFPWKASYQRFLWLWVFLTIQVSSWAGSSLEKDLCDWAELVRAFYLFLVVFDFFFQFLMCFCDKFKLFSELVVVKLVLYDFVEKFVVSLIIGLFSILWFFSRLNLSGQLRVTGSFSSNFLSSCVF